MGSTTITAIDNVSFTIEQGELAIILGAYGAGKSTVLNILGGMDAHTSGQVIIAGKDISNYTPNHLTAYRRTDIGFVFQFHHLLPEFTAMENVCIPGYIARRDRTAVERQARELLEMLGMEPRTEHKPAELSGGEPQRVAIARALINSPAVLLADEPSGNLDSKNKEEIHKLFFTLRDRLGQTVVIVTHDEQLARMSDREIMMVDGWIRP